MKIGIVAFSGMYPFKFGGPQEAIYHILKHISNSTDIEFKVFLRLYENNFREDAISSFRNVEIHPFVIRHGEEIKLVYASSKVLTGSKDLDVVHYNAPPYFLDIPVLKFLKKPITFDFHGGLFTENLFEGKFHLRLLASTLKNSFRITAPFFNHVIVHSQYMKNSAMYHGVPENRIKVVPIGIDIKEFDKSKKICLDGDPIILFVGRLERVKGCHVLLHALPEFIKEYPRLCLYIIGKGPMEKYLLELTSKLGINNNIHFVGLVPRDKLLSYYKSADICVFPSTYNEGFGITVLEAMAAGNVVIASATGGMKERIVSGMDGCLVKRNDVQDLKEKLFLLLADANLRKVLAKNAYETARRYDWSIIAKYYNDIFVNSVMRTK